MINTWRYQLKGTEAEPFEWAIIFMDEVGCFSALSDYGNYAYHWPLDEGYDFRRQFLRYGRHYLLEKLDGKDCYRPERALETVKRAIFDLPREERGAELSLLKKYNNLALQSDLYEYYYTSGSKIDFCEVRSKGYSHQAEAFVDNVIPRLQKLIKLDLLTEGKTEMATLV